MAVVKVEFKDLREAVNSLNESGLITEPIKLVGVEKELILKAFMDIVENIPNNAEGKFPGPKVVLDFYNSILDAEESIKLSKKGDDIKPIPENNVVDNSVNSESPVKPTIAKPSTKKEKKISDTVKKDAEKKVPCTTRIMMIVVDNPGISSDDIKAILEREGYKVSDNTLIMQKNDTLKTIKYIESKKA